MQASGQLRALVTSLQGMKSVCVHLVAHLFVIRNHYYDFYFAVLFKLQTQGYVTVVLHGQFSLSLSLYLRFVSWRLLRPFTSTLLEQTVLWCCAAGITLFIS